MSAIDIVRAAVAQRINKAMSTASTAIATATPEAVYPGIKGKIAQWLSPNFAMIPPTAGSRNLLLLYRTSPWVHMLVNKIALSSSMCEFYLEDEKGQRINDHEVLDFLRSGCEFLTSLQCGVIHYAYMDLVGESFWLIGRDNDDKPASYLPIPPTWVLDVASGIDGVYKIAPPNTVPFELEARDVFWFKNPDPNDPIRRGTSLTRAMNTEIQVEQAATSHLYSFLKNRARPDLLITGTSSAPMQETDVRRLEEIWLPRFQGANNSGKPFFSSNELNVKEVGASLREHEMSQLRRDETDYISQLYGVPPEIFGRVTNSNRATIDGADYLYNSHVISPRVKMLTSPLDARLRYEFPSMRGLKLKFESPIKEDTEIFLKALVAAPWAYSINDIRAVTGHAPVAGEEGLARPPIPTETQTTDGGTAPGSVPKKPNTNVAPKKKRLDTNVIKRALSGDDIVNICDVFDDDDEDDDPDMAALAYVMDGDFAEFGKLASPGYATGPDSTLWIADAIRNMLDQIDTTTSDTISVALDDIRDDEMTKSDLIAFMRGFFASWMASRAKLIAETETTNLAGFAIVSALRVAGVETKTWRTVGDDRVRDQHASMDGQTVPINGKFVAPSGSETLHPGGFGVPELDINCRCRIESGDHEISEGAYDEIYVLAVDRLVAEIQTRFQRQLQSVIARIDAL